MLTETGRRKSGRGGTSAAPLASVFLILPWLLFACSGSGAKELYETAEFEELQNNHRHAVELYERIVKEYPKSDYAPKAKERLENLGRQ